jgi:hypothetical protein
MHLFERIAASKHITTPLFSDSRSIDCRHHVRLWLSSGFRSQAWFWCALTTTSPTATLAIATLPSGG